MRSQDGTMDLLSPWSRLQASCSIDDAQGRIAPVFVALATNMCSGYQKSSPGARETGRMCLKTGRFPVPLCKHGPRGSTKPAQPHQHRLS